MPEEHPVETFDTVDLDQALVLVAFPTTGSASLIAAQYMARHLNLPLVGHVRLPELAGLVSIQDGLVTSPIRIFGGEVACRIGKDCPRVYIVVTDIPLPPPVLARAGDALMSWAASGGAHMMLVLEGVGRAEGDDVPDVFSASAQADVRAMLTKAGIPAMERAILAGISAQVLLDGSSRGIATGAVLVEASRDHPDGRAAVALLEAVAHLIPDVPVDAEPLRAEAMALEAEIDHARKEAAHVQAPPPASTFI